MREKQTTVKLIKYECCNRCYNNESLKKPLGGLNVVHCLDRKEEEKEPSFASTFTKLI